MPDTANPYRILCLDGGGRWSLISVMALQKIFGPQARGHDILKQLDLVELRSVMAQPIFVDGRNLYDHAKMEQAGLTYLSIGRGAGPSKFIPLL